MVMSYQQCFEKINEVLKTTGAKNGLEFHPFCIGWYNEQVKTIFHLPYPPNTLAFCIVSAPSFFEDVFLPYLCNVDYNDLKDPLDQCLSTILDCLKNSFKNDVDIIHDYELHPTRRPKVLVQTAGHVAGAAYYYKKTDVTNQPWGEQKIYGVSLHPRYGGWFGFRGVMVFKDVEVLHLRKNFPKDSLSNEKKIWLLDAYNFHWKDWTFRDVSSPTEKYSELQKKYFQTKPVDRFDLIKDLASRCDDK